MADKEITEFGRQQTLTDAIVPIVNAPTGAQTNEYAYISDINVNHGITTAETAAGVTPTNYAYAPGDIRRYGSGLGDGSNNDSTAFRNMIAFPGYKFVPKPSSKYMLDSIVLAVDDLYIFFEPGTVLEARAGYGASASMFHFGGADDLTVRSNIVFDGPGCIFQMPKAEYTTGEDRHVFRIINSSDIYIRGITAYGAGGDGFVIGTRNNYGERVYIEDCVSDNCRRNGVSITSGKDIYFINHLSKNNIGTSPQAGYDIEPDDTIPSTTTVGGPLENINLTNCRSLNNAGNGFQYTGGDDLVQAIPFSINFNNCTSNGDVVNFQVSTGDPSGTQTGMVTFTNCHGFDSQGNGIEINGSNMPVVWVGGSIFNPNQLPQSDPRYGSAVSLLSVSGTDGQDMGNVFIRGLKVRDPDGNMLKTVSLQLVSEATSTISDVEIEVDAKGVAATKRSFESGSNALAPVSIKYTDQPEFAQTASTGSSSTGQYANQKITNAGAGAGYNFQIDSATSQYIGNHYDFEVTDAQLLTITSSAGTILPGALTTLESNTIGSKLRLEWDGAAWQITHKDGTWNAPTELVTTTNVITVAESGKTFYLNAAGGFTSTLPAPAIGLKYKFIVKTAPTTTYIITTTSGANILQGSFIDIVGELAPIVAKNTLNFIGTTSIVGDYLEVESDGTSWFCKAASGADGGITVA